MRNTAQSDQLVHLFCSDKTSVKLLQAAGKSPQTVLDLFLNLRLTLLHESKSCLILGGVKKSFEFVRLATARSKREASVLLHL